MSNYRNPKTKNQQSTLPLWGAMACFTMAFCYVGMFMLFFVVLDMPHTASLNDKVAYMSEHLILIHAGNIVGYLLFGCLLLIAVQALHAKVRANHSSELINTASVFGLIWVVLMMCSGLISVVGLQKLVVLHSKASPHLGAFFDSYNTIVDALGGGIEIVGGLWVLLFSLCALRYKLLTKVLNIWGLMVGILGILTIILSVPEFKDAFGLTQIVWFIWVGIRLLADAKQTTPD